MSAESTVQRFIEEMLSPLSAASPSNAAEMQSGTLVASNTGLAIESPKPDSRTRKIRQSPFKVPEDNSIFLLRMKEKERQKEEMRQYLALPVHERQTFTGRTKTKQRELIEKLDEEEGEKEKMDKLDQLKEVRPHSLPGKQALKMAMIKQENIEKESIQDFITKKREKFLQEYSLLAKRSEMKKLEDATVAEERRLKRAEQQLERDALLFEEFLKENNKNSVEAVKTADQETQTKLQRIAEIKRLTAEMVTIKSEISKNEEIMKDYNMYKEFLFKLSPPEWQEAQRASKALLSDRDTHDKEKDHHAEIKPGHRRGVISTGRELPPIRECRSSSGRSNRSSANSRCTPTPCSKLDTVDSDSPEYEDEPELYFSEPQQLLDLLTELEEQNLSLIQNSTETEEALEELRHTMENSKRKMERDAAQLSSQIDTMTETIAREKKRAAELDLKVRLFSFGKVKTEDQDSMLDALGRKVEEVYRSCVGDKKANPSTMQMLAHIESRVSTLLDNIESIPTDTLEKVERIKEKEKRIRQREEKQQQQKQKQEERLKKSLERAQAVVKKKSGRKLMPRSKPVARKVKLTNVKDISDQEELHAYFFT